MEIIRKLTAIMPAHRSLCKGGPARCNFSEGGFTDIIRYTYTALMGSDEDRAFELLGKNREIHSELIQVFKRTQKTKRVMESKNLII